METVAPILDVAKGHPYLSLASFILGSAALVRLARSHSRPPLPPGPKGYPVIGNLLDLPPNHVWERLGELSKQHVMYLNALGQQMVILSSSKAAFDLLEKKSAIYSDRPVVMMCGEIIGWNKSLALTQYGPRFREFRKYMNKLFGTRAAVERFAPLQEKESAKFLAKIIADPGSLVQQIRKTTGAIILMIAYGYSVQEEDDPFVKVVEASVNGFSESLEPGAFLVDVIPSLRYVPDWFPGTGWKVKAKRFSQLLLDMANIPNQLVKDQMAAGTAIPSYTSQLLESKNITPEDDYNIKWSAASLYSGGADTTVSAIHSFFLAMMINPEVQRKAQEEIDRVIGNDRLPTLADQASLPYVEAITKEVLRWNPVAPLGIPHVTMEDDVYEGYFIPKGAQIIANLWQIMHDPAVHADPMAFNPERFLGDRPEPEPRATAFGHGRRICPGLLLAQTSLWLACARSLAVLNITKYVDGFGNVVEPEIHYTDGTISHPPPFKCTIRPRSEKAAALVASVEL
ncbi:cytochrome P450 [Thelephora terrestris]|uniref:Cytochrome P450 n=1 Tax=Thelephora terrestris TaxID=56493 RepID=A0A9P6L4R4_9AGAM|nr:cytochrome P450 [Thelephora terrestris]